MRSMDWKRDGGVGRGATAGSGTGDPVVIMDRGATGARSQAGIWQTSVPPDAGPIIDIVPWDSQPIGISIRSSKRQVIGA